jgi:hypothetical protein
MKMMHKEVGVTSHIMVLETCVQRHGMKISMCKVHGYQCMCKTVESVDAAVETQIGVSFYVSRYSISKANGRS